MTNGSAEANFISMWNLVEPGAEAVVMLPNYMQVWGLAKTWGAVVRPWWLREDRRWSADLDALPDLINQRTRLIAICNPNNPTGAVLSEPEMDEICRLADRVGAWILSDEVYRGAEVEGPMTPSFWGRYDRVVVTCGLSKACRTPRLAHRVGCRSSAKDRGTLVLQGLHDNLADVAIGSARPGRARAS